MPIGPVGADGFLMPGKKRSQRALRYTSTADMPEGLRRMVEAKIADPPTQRARSGKYNASPTVVEGIRFDSKREARHFEKLRARQRSGDIAFFLRQVPMRLPGGTKLVLDFLLFMSKFNVRTTGGEMVEISIADVLEAGGIRLEDAKGFETKEFRIKRREIEHHYKVRIALV